MLPGPRGGRDSRQQAHLGARVLAALAELLCVRWAVFVVDAARVVAPVVALVGADAQARDDLLRVRVRVGVGVKGSGSGWG